MNSKSIPVLVLLISLFTVNGAPAAPEAIKHLDTYRQQGVEQVDVEQGSLLWNVSVNDRSCTSCHGVKPANVGIHTRTGKSIKPMALSVNPERYQSAKKIEKWFLRNCKWTFGRECSLQEKADILTWLASQ